MARCEGTTRSGSRCKLDVRPGSSFCHLHDTADEEGNGADTRSSEETVEFGDLIPLLVAGAVAAGFVLFLRGFGKWIPRF